MKIERQKMGTVDVLAPIGAMIDPESKDFLDQLLKLVESTNPRVVVSLHETAYMDSAAIEGLLAASDVLQTRATSLKLACVTPTCREIFELTGVSRQFSFFQDVPDAVRSFL